MTFGKLFTTMCHCHQAGTDLRAVMPYGGEGNCGLDSIMAAYHRVYE